MAIIHSNSRCAICERLLGNERIFATSGVFLRPDDPLFRCCDAPFHWSCYERWPERTRFARAYVDSWVEEETLNPYCGKAYLDDLALVTVNPSPPVEKVLIRLYRTGSGISVPLSDWTLWLANVENAHLDVHPAERTALLEVLPRLRETVPAASDLMAAVDWSSKRRKAEEARAARLQDEQTRLQAVSAFDKLCWKLDLERKHKGLVCPHCGQYSKDIRYVDRSPEDRSYFVCRTCGRSFGPECG